ncbi:MAG: signal peptidase I [Spirochaetaceae bacterium]|nr:MAG: signal peptidase I [Spirochaetaceae bacterium]
MLLLYTAHHLVIDIDRKRKDNYRFMSRHADDDLSPAVLIGPAILLLVVLTVVIDLAWVDGESMMPHLQPGRTVMVHRLAYGLRAPLGNSYLLHWDKPQKNDIIVFHSPVDGRLAIKRVVGPPGAAIEAGNAVVLVGGEVYDVPGSVADRLKLITRIPDTQLFVVGDNRDGSTDSRSYGLIEFSSVRGRILFPRISSIPGPVR